VTRAALATAAVVLAASACKREQPEETRPPPGEAWLTPQQLQATQVSIAPVEERTVATQLGAPGRIAFDDSRVAHVFSPVSGRVVRIDAQPGDRVRKGAALVTLDAPDVGNAASDVRKAEADLQAAERELRRQRELFEAHAGAQRDLEAAQAARDRAQAELARARERARLFRRGVGVSPGSPGGPGSAFSPSGSRSRLISALALPPARKQAGTPASPRRAPS